MAINNGRYASLFATFNASALSGTPLGQFFFKEKIFFNTCHTVGHTSRCPIYSVSRLSAVMNSAQFAQLCTEQVNSDWLEKVVLFVYFLFKISSAYWKFY